MSLLQAQDIKSGYGEIEILHGVSLSLEKGEVLTIIGPNGAGKSTMLKTIMGYLPVRSGKLIFQDKDVASLSPDQKVRIGIAYVPQINNVFPGLTVKETLEMGGYTLDSNVRKGKILGIYELFPILKEEENRLAKTLSGGQKQTLAMGRALMTDPDLLLLDEPSAGLAPELAKDVFQKIKEIRKTGSAIIIVEQDAYQSLELSDKGLILKMGRKEFEGKAKDILENTDLAEAYLGA